MKQDLEDHIATLIHNRHYQVIRRDTGLIVLGEQYAHYTGKHLSFGNYHKERISKALSKLIKRAIAESGTEMLVH